MPPWLTPRLRVPFAFVLLLASGLLVAPTHAQPAEAPGQAHMEGRVTVSPAVDSTQQYNGFNVLVAQRTGGGIDTLGSAVTDASGAFAMDVQALDRRIVPLVISRRGEALLSADYVVAPGDSSVLNVQFPLGNRPLQIRSPENSAWLAYQNTLALYRQSLVQSLQSDSMMAQAMDQRIEQTVAILWDLSDAFPNTLGAAHAKAETIILLEGWDDALAVERAQRVAPENPRYIEVARAARRAQARRAGQEAALALLDQFQQRARNDNQRAALLAEVARARIDSTEQRAALVAARALASAYPDTDWANWADRAAYEVQNLMPGMEVPGFSVTTWQGTALDLSDLRGRPVLLEFYDPADALYRKQLPTRNAIYEGTRASDLAVVSVSLQPDSLLNEGFFDGRELPGTHVVAPQEQVRGFINTYNVGALPTRFLIDAQGRIVDKYVGSGFSALQDVIARRFTSKTPSP